MSQAIHAPALARRPFDGIFYLWAASLIGLLVLVVLPLGVLMASSFYDEGWSLQGYLDFFADRRMLQAAGNSLLLALFVCVGSVAIGAPLALGVARIDMRGKALVRATIVISLVSPDFLLAMAYIALAGPNAGYLNVLIRGPLGIGSGPGPLNVFSLGGLILTALPHGVAYVFLSLAPALRNADPAFDEAGRLAGAKPLRAIFDILLPALRPALLSGALLAFAGSLAVFGPADLLRINVLTVSIRESLSQLEFQEAAVQSVALCVISLAALLVYRHFTRQAERFRTMGGRAFAPRNIPVGRAAHAFTALGLGYALVTLLLPYGSMALISFFRSVGRGPAWDNLTLDNYAAILGNPSVQDAAGRSIVLASCAGVIVVALGLAIGYVVVQTRYPLRWLLDILSTLPLAIPGTALAIALAVAYLNPPLNRLGLYGSSGILLLAYLARFIPFGARASQTALVQLSKEFEDAARVFGSGPLRSVLDVVVPLLAQNLIYAGLLVLILALPELSASVILKGINTQTLSTALLDIWNGNGGLAPACALSTLLFASITVLLGLAALLARSGKAATPML